jgi:F0F1-type ATP synthase membrane subunit c/vacuolar-type H+-ATPase subunit K
MMTGRLSARPAAAIASSSFLSVAVANAESAVMASPCASRAVSIAARTSSVLTPFRLPMPATIMA